MGLNVKVHGKQTRLVEVEVSATDVVKQLVQSIREQVGLGYRQWINSDGEIYEETVHGPPADFRVGPATEEQINVYRITSEFEKMTWRLTA